MSSLVYTDLYGTHDLVDKAIKGIQHAARKNKLCVRFSGGKDSVVTEDLFKKAGVEYQTIYSKTTVDPPEVLAFIKKYYPQVTWDIPRQSMFQLIVKKGFPPTRLCRYCCREFKERNVCPKGSDVFTCTGIRWQESKKRGKRSMYETCMLSKGLIFYHPIIDWSDTNVWDYISEHRLPYLSLYDEGFERVGCVGCPMTSSKKMEREFRRWPNFEKAYLWAFEKMLEGRNFDKWKSSFDVMDWYIHGAEARYQQLEGQLSMFKGEYYEYWEAGDIADELTTDDARTILLGNAA